MDEPKFEHGELIPGFVYSILTGPPYYVKQLCNDHKLHLRTVAHRFPKGDVHVLLQTPTGKGA